MIASIDGPMILRFIEESEEFIRYADERFKMIHHGHDDDGGIEAVDLGGFRAELMEMMVAMAQGIGTTPLNVMLDEGGLLMKVYEAEIARFEKEKKERNLGDNEKENGDHVDGEIGGVRKTSKKKSIKLLSCVCFSTSVIT